MPTTTRGWTLPTDGGSSDTWGDILNSTTFPAIDTDVTSVETTADAALPKAGGTMTGNIALTSATSTITALGSVSGAQALDCSLGSFFTLTCSGAVTLSLTNVPTGGSGIIVKITNGTLGVTHPTGTLWAAGSAPTLSSGTDWIGYILTNGATAPVGVSVALAVA